MKSRNFRWGNTLDSSDDIFQPFCTEHKTPPAGLPTAFSNHGHPVQSDLRPPSNQEAGFSTITSVPHPSLRGFLQCSFSRTGSLVGRDLWSPAGDDVDKRQVSPKVRLTSCCQLTESIKQDQLQRTRSSLGLVCVASHPGTAPPEGVQGS